MERVTDKTIVQLGKLYLVKCALMKSDWASYSIPVIGSFHRDQQLGFDKMHYHIDGRFTGKKNYFHREVDENGRTNHLVHNDPPGGFQIKSIVYKKLICKRLTTGIKVPPPEESRAYRKWYASMIGKSCKGRKCPHLGFTMQEENGRLVCPLHNLQGSLQTETIIEMT